MIGGGWAVAAGKATAITYICFTVSVSTLASAARRPTINLY
jgi:hypothetical protein